MLNTKKMNVCYLICLLCILAATFIVYPNFHNKDLAEEAGELLRNFYIFEYALFVFLFLVKKKYIKHQMILKNMKYIFTLHKLVGVSCVALLSFHVALLFHVDEMWDIHYLEGYAITIFTVAAILAMKMKKVMPKIFLNAHKIFAALSIIPFLLHI